MRSATRNRKGKDDAYREWLHLQPCMITGKFGVTIHHVRKFGSLRDDRRAIPLVSHLHMLTHEIKGQPCVERGKKIFEKFWDVDLEAAIIKYNEKYEKEVNEKNSITSIDGTGS